MIATIEDGLGYGSRYNLRIAEMDSES